MRLPAAAALLLALAAGGEEAAPARDLEVPAGKHGAFPAYIPAGADPRRPCPLVVACHGHGDTAANFLACLKGEADAGHFALLAPEGTEKAENGFGWNGFPDRTATILGAIKALLKDHPEVDAKRIVWLGHSAGCWVCCADGAGHPETCHGIVLSAPPTAAPECPAKGPRPRVCLFMGTEDFNFKGLGTLRAALKAAKLPAYAVNQVTGLAHAMPAQEYVVGAIHWALAGEGETEENVLPREPPDALARGCRHLLVRHKGAEGAGAEVKRTPEAARKEAQKLAELLRKERTPEGMAERARKASDDAGTRETGGALSEEAASGFGPLLRWACWAVPKGEVRLVRTGAGFHLVWAER